MGCLLVANIGNARVALGTCALPPAGECPQPTSARSFPAPDTDSFLPDFEPEAPVGAAIFASVNPPADRAVIGWISEQFGIEPLRFPLDVPLPMENRCEPPEAVGSDRLANAVAAHHEAHAKCLIVDAGTAVTVDAVAGDEAAFLGGAILPGIGLAAHSLAKGTALLPNLTVKERGAAIGTSTAAAISSGVARGVAGAVDRLLADMTEELGGCEQVFLTGGDAARIERLCKTPMTLRPHLTLTGLALAWTAWSAG
ncbi:MAG: type III pantothenate kinase [Planctomycetota bacterium]